MSENINPEDFEKIITNPFYCLSSIAEVFTRPHDPFINEDEWILINSKFIREIGPERWLKLLLENLKGNYVKP